MAFTWRLPDEVWLTLRCVGGLLHAELTTHIAAQNGVSSLGRICSKTGHPQFPATQFIRVDGKAFRLPPLLRRAAAYHPSG